MSDNETTEDETPYVDRTQLKLDQILLTLSQILGTLNTIALQLGKDDQQLYTTWTSTDTSNICPSCGIDFNGNMGYVCNSTSCPYQAKTTCGGSN